jgi:hypothetical protein
MLALSRISERCLTATVQIPQRSMDFSIVAGGIVPIPGYPASSLYRSILDPVAYTVEKQLAHNGADRFLVTMKQVLLVKRRSQR